MHGNLNTIKGRDIKTLTGHYGVSTAVAQFHYLSPMMGSASTKIMDNSITARQIKTASSFIKRSAEDVHPTTSSTELPVFVDAFCASESTHRGSEGERDYQNEKREFHGQWKMKTICITRVVCATDIRSVAVVVVSVSV
jgi:hypothetical protein